MIPPHPLARMADSVEPDLIPLVFAKGGNGVALYVDGDWPASPAEFGRWPHHIGITVTGALERAREARVIDVESGDATAGHAPNYIARRGQLLEGPNDGMVYCNRATLPALVRQFDLQRQRLPWLWIATLDGQHWTPANLAQNIYAHDDVQIPPELIACIQWLPAGHYDESSIWKAWDWTPRGKA